MKTLFVTAKSNLDVDVVKKVRFEGRLGLLTTAQHLHKLHEIKKLLPNSVIAGQVVGCDVSNAKRVANKVDAFLFVGSGRFHPLQVALETGKRVLTADPYTGIVGEVTKEEIEERKRKERIGYTAFLNADTIGILVSIKPGQYALKKAERLKKRLEAKGKRAFIFLFDTLDFTQLENFPDVQCWVNTACPRMAIEDFEKFSKPVVNIDKI